MEKLDFSYDLERDILTVEGKKYSGELFRFWSKNPEYMNENDTFFQLIPGFNDAVTIKKYQVEKK